MENLTQTNEGKSWLTNLQDSKDVTATCVYSSEVNSYNRCDGLSCDHDAVCASGCCISGLCDAYWCSGGVGLEVWLLILGALCILMLSIFVCLKARRRIKEDDHKDKLRK